jgi:hypothetical protein
MWDPVRYPGGHHGESIRSLPFPSPSSLTLEELNAVDVEMISGTVPVGGLQYSPVLYCTVLGPESRGTIRLKLAFDAISRTWMRQTMSHIWMNERLE